jgi:nitrogen fixation protein NifU and related proteins
MSLEDLYREVILDHYRNPRNRAPIADPDGHAEGVNPLCGDEITVDVGLDGERVEAVSVRGHGCSISQSSASMMSEAILGKSVQEVRALTGRFKAMMDIDRDGDPGIDPDRPGAALGDLEALQGVKQYPVRIKCADLAWTTLEQALDDAGA